MGNAEENKAAARPGAQMQDISHGDCVPPDVQYRDIVPTIPHPALTTILVLPGAAMPTTAATRSCLPLTDQFQTGHIKILHLGKPDNAVRDGAGATGRKAQPSTRSWNLSSEMSFRPSWLGNHLPGRRWK